MIAGSYPRTLNQCLGQWNTSGAIANHGIISRLLPSGDPTRLFQFVLGDGQHVFMGRGLGGGSLINSGVFLEADRDTLRRGPWPEEIRDNPSVLQKC